MKHIQLRFIAIAAVVSIFGVAGYAVASPLISTTAIHRMLVTRVKVQHQATGIVVGIVEPAGRRIISYGVTSRHKGKPVNGNTVFGIGSLTKVFTALLLSEVAQRGKVKLGNPVGEYLPDSVSLPTFAGKRITLLDLSTHTAGLPLRPTNLKSGCCKGYTLDQMIKSESSEYAGYTVSDLYQFLSSYKLTHAPGSHYRYSNVGYGLLAIALSRRLGKSYPELIQRSITTPLHMNQTRVILTPAMTRHLASGYLYYGGQLIAVPREKFGSLQGAAALYSSANNLLNFLDAVLDIKRTPLQTAMSAMTDVKRPGGMAPPNVIAGSTQIAMGWNIYSDGKKEIVWKNGSVSGYRSFIGYDPEHRIGIVALSNGQSSLGADDIGFHILDPHVPFDTTVPKLYKQITLGPRALAQYVGTYRYSPTDTITISRHGNHLIVLANGAPKMEMFAYGENEFFLKVADIQITFENIRAGHATRAVWHHGEQSEVGTRTQ